MNGNALMRCVRGQRRHKDVVGPELTRVMVALLVVYERDRRATISALEAELPLSRMTIWEHLHRLEANGLVATKPPGALRPLVRRVHTKR